MTSELGGTGFLGNCLDCISGLYWLGSYSNEIELLAYTDKDNDITEDPIIEIYIIVIIIIIKLLIKCQTLLSQSYIFFLFLSGIDFCCKKSGIGDLLETTSSFSF